MNPSPCRHSNYPIGILGPTTTPIHSPATLNPETGLSIT